MRKRMRTVDIEEASYDDVKEVVAEDNKEEVPPESIQVDVAVQPQTEPETTTNEVTDDGFIEVKPKKQAPRATCEWCGREMTAKNLKYTHSAICPSKPQTSEPEGVAPPPQPLVRAETIVEPVEPEQTKPKAKAKPRARKVTVSTAPPEVQAPPTHQPEPPKRRSRAAARAECYEKLAASALP